MDHFFHQFIQGCSFDLDASPEFFIDDFDFQDGFFQLVAGRNRVGFQFKEVLQSGTDLYFFLLFLFKDGFEVFDFLEELKAENNHIVRMWQQCGLEVENAGDSQALIQLKKEYCDKKECLRCRIGYEYLKR